MIRTQGLDLYAGDSTAQLLPEFLTLNPYCVTMCIPTCAFKNPRKKEEVRSPKSAIPRRISGIRSKSAMLADQKLLILPFIGQN